MVGESGDLDACGFCGAVGAGCAAAEGDGGGDGFETFLEGGRLGEMLGEGLIEEARGDEGVVYEAEAILGEVAEAAADAVADHECAGEYGGGDGHAGDGGEVGGAEVAEVTEEE